MTIEPTVEDANFKIIIRRQRHVNTCLSNFTTGQNADFGNIFLYVFCFERAGKSLTLCNTVLVLKLY